MDFMAKVYVDCDPDNARWVEHVQLWKRKVMDSYRQPTLFATCIALHSTGGVLGVFPCNPVPHIDLCSMPRRHWVAPLAKSGSFPGKNSNTLLGHYPAAHFID